MSANPRFRLRFLDKTAEREYRKLDGSTKILVDNGYRKLMERADEIGKDLHGSLYPCKELKFRKQGIRIVFRIIDESGTEYVEIIATGKRSDGEVFATSEKRLENESNYDR